MSAERTAVVRAQGLAKRYASEGPMALAGVDAEVAAGEVLAVMGPSGSGKSTLLHLLGALDVPTTGTVEIAGRPLAALDDAALSELRRDHIGFVFQSFNLIPVLTAAENVGLPGVISRWPRQKTARRVDEILELVGLRELGDKLPAHLSGGEQQRVAIARALMLQPPLLLADEPTGNLDSVTGLAVLELLRLAADELATAVVMVTHDPLAASFGDRLLLLRDGTVERELTVAGTNRDQRTEAVLGALAGGTPAVRRAPLAAEGAAHGIVDD